MDTKDEITTACRDGLLLYEVCHRVLGRIQALGRDCESHHTRGVPGESWPWREPPAVYKLLIYKAGLGIRRGRYRTRPLAALDRGLSTCAMLRTETEKYQVPGARLPMTCVRVPVPLTGTLCVRLDAFVP